jgi:hypothetical protein
LIFVIPTGSGYEKDKNQPTTGSRIKIKRITGSGYLKKQSDSKIRRFWVFQKLQRAAGFHAKRTNKSPMILSGYLIFKNWVFDFFPGKRLNVKIPTHVCQKKKIWDIKVQPIFSHFTMNIII